MARDLIARISSALDQLLVPEDFADVDVGEYVSSVRQEAPEFTLPKGIAAKGLYFGGVWLFERGRPTDPDFMREALVFYGEAYYKKICLARTVGGFNMFGIEDFSYFLDGDRIIRYSMAERWPRDEDESDSGDSEEEVKPVTLDWRHENGRLDINDRLWRSYRPSDMAELIAVGLRAKKIKFIHVLALLGDRDFKERVDELPLRSTHTG